ncbi:uncharacterized protein LOC131170222 [Hevea brasiliensis]|uniref:uncharacterized protein LOC131170222 n=1 Tax=Hevea brasiliensis TaxID=3981 RepID=UPI0025DF7359|nr:uncharacterized protein LOC131170222 [Hevea brasiliensis]
MYDSVDVSSLRLVPDVVVPPKFKVPEFDKYNGNSDPRIHLATYIAKMSALTEDDRLLIEENGSTPNVTSNPLPHHDSSKGNGVNVVESQDQSLVTELDLLVPYFDEILMMATSEGYVHPYRHETRNDFSGSGCPYHGATDHELQACDEFKEEIWRMISLKILRCQLRSKEEEEVNTAIYGKSTTRSALKMSFSIPAPSTPPTPPQTIKRTPPQLLVTNTRVVPWNYNFQVYTQNASSSTSIPTLNHTYTQHIPAPKPCFTPHAHFKMTYAGPSNDSAPQFMPKLALTNDSQNPEVEFITRSGRCYGTEEKKSKGKVEVGESTETEEKMGKVVEKGESSGRKEEDELLLQIMKQSEYDEEIDSAGLKHTKALHVTVKWRGCLVAKVLIDNGSALNVLPNATLAKLPIDPSGMSQSSMIVRAFDGTKRDMLGEIDLPLQIGASARRNGRSGLGYDEDALIDGRFQIRSLLRDQRFDKPLEMKKIVPKILDVFTRPIIENLKEEDEESPSKSSINVLHLDAMPGILILPAIEE